MAMSSPTSASEQGLDNSTNSANTMAPVPEAMHPSMDAPPMMPGMIFAPSPAAGTLNPAANGHQQQQQQQQQEQQRMQHGDQAMGMMAPQSMGMAHI
jgi:hypothetical protein